MAPVAPLPRFDGIYVSVGVLKDHPSPRADPIESFFRRFGRASYTRAYARFFEDGLLVYGDHVINYDSEPARPALDREWGNADHRFRWMSADGRLQITAPSGAVSDARIEQDRLLWDSGQSYTQGTYTFLRGIG